MAWQLVNGAYQRALGDSEHVFFSASHTAVGDMFLHLSFRAPMKALLPERVLCAWAVILLRHPLLLCQVDTVSSSEPLFRFTPPKDIQSALDATRTRLSFRKSNKQGLISEYLNGGRFLTDKIFSHLCISHAIESPLPAGIVHHPVNGVNGHAQTNGIVDEAEYDLLMCSPHFSGDGAALHQCAQELLVILGSSKPDLHARVQHELDLAANAWEHRLPLAMETRLRQPKGRWAVAASRINFAKAQEREVGGHALPRRQRFAQNTILKERAFSPEETRAMLAQCKANGVTANHTLFALVDMAWAKTLEKGQDLPIMTYTALNLRPYLNPSPFDNDQMSYWFLALTYFNVVLPSFLPTSNTLHTFWERTRSAKLQIASVVQSPFLISRALMMAALRSQRAGRAPGPESILPPPQDALARLAPRPSAPSKALMGISLMGNLDKIYIASMYPSIRLLDVATASRQRQGGILLLSHTFRGRLSLHLVYDEFGFEEGTMERFWSGLQGAAEEFLIGTRH